MQVTLNISEIQTEFTFYAYVVRGTTRKFFRGEKVKNILRVWARRTVEESERIAKNLERNFSQECDFA